MKNIKMNTALLVCSVFLFRIVFFNAFAAPASEPQDNSVFQKAHFSTTMKRRAHLEATDSIENAEYSFADLCEESASSENKQVESNPFSLIQILYLPVKSGLSNTLKNAARFCNRFSAISSHRYLVLQVFRT